MTHLNTNAVTDNTITNKAQEQFLLEDIVERDFALGLITEDEYEVEIQKIYYSFADLYGFPA
jgi:uncharacterized membrane protein|tara:strand:- start:98 stop:283 length:186 start_codon:yes stop_codon:yes gene_type:complete